MRQKPRKYLFLETLCTKKVPFFRDTLYDKLLDAFVMKYAERVTRVHKQMLPKKVDLSETYVVFTKYFSSVRNK